MADIPWRERIPGTLGSKDREFARHEADKERAFDMLGQLRTEGVGLTDVLGEYGKLLRSEGCLPKHVNAQRQRVRRFFGPWIRD